MPGLKEKIKEAQILGSFKKKIKPNLTKEEIKALEELKTNPDIVIKKADKDKALESYKVTKGQAHLNYENINFCLTHRRS